MCVTEARVSEEVFEQQQVHYRALTPLHATHHPDPDHIPNIKTGL